LLQNLVNLKDVNLSNCEHITFLLDLSKARNLERLNLQFCKSLVKFPSSVQHLDKLVDLDLRGCKMLVEETTGGGFETLKEDKTQGFISTTKAL
jgi:hypothetical protein